MNPTFRAAPTPPALPPWTARPGSASPALLPAGFPSAVAAHYPVFGSSSIAPALRATLTGLLRSAACLLSPLFALLLFPAVASYLFPRLRLNPIVSLDRVSMRPPGETAFFQEMGALGIALAAVVILQWIVTLGGRKNAPWTEASVVGGLFAYAAYGVLRGFHTLLSDSWLFPLSSLWLALAAWVFFAALILSPRWRSAVS